MKKIFESGIVKEEYNIGKIIVKYSFLPPYGNRKKVELVRVFGFPEGIRDFFRSEECGKNIRLDKTLDSEILKTLKELPEHVQAVIGINKIQLEEVVEENIPLKKTVKIERGINYWTKTILKECVDKYGLEVKTNKKKYIGFLERQIEEHKEYDLGYKTPSATKKSYPYRNLMIDKLLLFSYLIGEKTIIAGRKGIEEEKRIGKYKTKKGRWKPLEPKEEREKDLYVLRSSEMGGFSESYLDPAIVTREKESRRTDKILWNLYGRTLGRKILMRRTGIEMPNWGEMIDELGQDKEVKEYFGQEINYDMVLNSESPYPSHIEKNLPGSKYHRTSKDRKTKRNIDQTGGDKNTKTKDPNKKDESFRKVDSLPPGHFAKILAEDRKWFPKKK